jgi:hypothetical protein
MKKLMTIGIAAAALFTLAGQAKATALETSGEIRARAWYVDNYVTNGRSTEWFDQRLRLNLVWPVAEGVKVNVRADILEGFWGENAESISTNVKQNPDGTFSVVTTTSGTPTKPPIAFDHVNMQFAWPGAPLTFTVGRQDVSWGAGYFAKADNRDRFKVVAKFAPELSIGFMYDKSKELFSAEGSTANIDDARGFTLAAFGAASGWSYGALGAYVLDETTPAAGVGVIKRIYGSAYAMGKAGPVDLKVEATYVTGDNKLTGKTKVDVSGLGAYVSAAMPAGPVTIALEGAYAGGDDPTTAENEGGFRADYQSPFWSIILYNNLDYPGYLGSATGNAVTSDYSRDFSVTNAVAGKASFTFVPVKGFTLILSGLYATALEDVKIGTTTYKKDGLGTEFDLVAVYNITDNVYFLGGVGYLVAGDFFGNVDNPMGVMGSLNVKF